MTDTQTLIDQLLDQLLMERIRVVVRAEIQAANFNGHDNESLLDVDGVAQALGVKPTWIYEQTRKKAEPQKPDLKDQPIPHLRVGRYPRFELSKVKAWIEARQKHR
jgi:predicted DNA-binding transcriptional regulator AlpA